MFFLFLITSRLSYFYFFSSYFTQIMWITLIFWTFNVFLALVHKKLEETNRRIMVEMEEERQHHQKLVKDYGRLQQRLENVKGIEDFFRICDTNLCNFYIKTSVESRPWLFYFCTEFFRSRLCFCLFGGTEAETMLGP